MTAPVSFNQPAARPLQLPPQATFDPAAWLAALTTIGGGYALTSNRRIAFLVDACDGEDLASVMGHLIGQPDRQEAVKRVIESRQNGELSV